MGNIFWITKRKIISPVLCMENAPDFFDQNSIPFTSICLSSAGRSQFKP